MGADRAKAPGVGIERLVDRRMDRDQLADPANFQEGDVLIFRRDVHGCSRGTISTITGVKDGMVEHVDPDGRSLSFRPTAGTFRNLAIHETETIRIHVGDRVRLASDRRTATVTAIGGNRVHLDLGRGQRLRLDHNDRRLRLLEPEWSVASPRTTSAIAVLDSGDPAGQASFALEAARAFDDCVLITDNREDLGLEEHHRLARTMPRGTGENLFVADPADAVIEAWRNFPHAGEDRDALMLATVMLGDDLPGDPLIEEARASLAGRMDEHAARAGLTARIDAHCRYWSDIRASGAPRMLDSWRDYAESLLEEGRAMIARPSEETGTRLSPAIESLAKLCRRDEVMGLLDLGDALAEGKPEGAAFYQPGWGGFIERLKAHSAANRSITTSNQRRRLAQPQRSLAGTTRRDRDLHPRGKGASHQPGRNGTSDQESTRHDEGPRALWRPSRPHGGCAACQTHHGTQGPPATIHPQGPGDLDVRNPHLLTPFADFRRDVSGRCGMFHISPIQDDPVIIRGNILRSVT